MNTVPQYADLLRSLDGMRNYRALAIVIAGFIFAVMVSMIGVATQSMIGMALFGLLGALIGAFAVNAAGIVLMRQALDQPPPAIGDAILGGMTSFVKLLAIMLILLLMVAGYTIVVALLLFLCKVPFVGPVLYAIILPVLIVASGAGFVGLILGAGLMAPAVWRGAGIQQALGELYAIVRDRLIETIVRFFLLTLLLTLVFGVVMAILGVGAGYSMLLSFGIVGGDVIGSGFGSLMGGGRYGMSNAAGFAYAGMFGMGVLYALVLAVGFCVTTMGNIIIYLAVSAGIDASAVEARIQAGVDQARQRAAEMEQRLRTPPPPPQPAPPPVVPVPPPVALVCPTCRTPIAGDDLFCGSCGQRLR